MQKEIVKQEINEYLNQLVYIHPVTFAKQVYIERFSGRCLRLDVHHRQLVQEQRLPRNVLQPHPARSNLTKNNAV